MRTDFHNPLLNSEMIGG